MDNNLDLSHFEALLKQRITDVTQMLEGHESRSQAVELDQSKMGRLSRVDALQQQAMIDAVHGRAHAERARLLVALRRLHEGDYGWCLQCGELIAVGRLEFDPATSLCISCASKAESA